MSITCAGIILAGGLNSRMNGVNKAFLKIDDRSFIDRIAEVILNVFDECILVTHNPEMYDFQGITILRDILPAQTPLSGIHAGLKHMKADYAFCTACDLPFLKKEIVCAMVEEIESGYDVIVPNSGTYYQPLCAVYSKRCIPLIESQVKENRLKLDQFYQMARVKKVPYEILQKTDPSLISFMNINTHQDLINAFPIPEPP